MTEIYYDPYDFEIDADPHPVWRRMRDEAPLYRNDKYEFWALSRYADVASGLTEWRTYSSARGTLLELIRNDVQFPAGMMIFEDPPLHDAHRALMARLFTPRRIAQIEPLVRAYCARSLEPLVGGGSIDFIADLGSQMPMRVIGMLLGIPEEDQEELRDAIDAGLSLEEGKSAPRSLQHEEGPVDQTARFVMRDVELHGTRVPEGSALLLLNGSANRDQREFEDADRLDVTRPNVHHLSFGHGIHFCLGASLARLEGCVALEEILARWADWEIDHEAAEMARTSTVRGWKKLPARI